MGEELRLPEQDDRSLEIFRSDSEDASHTLVVRTDMGNEDFYAMVNLKPEYFGVLEVTHNPTGQLAHREKVTLSEATAHFHEPTKEEKASWYDVLSHFSAYSEDEAAA
jgi:hypothetical protein